jgi:hypothetical protein
LGTGRNTLRYTLGRELLFTKSLYRFVHRNFLGHSMIGLQIVAFKPIVNGLMESIANALCKSLQISTFQGLAQAVTSCDKNTVWHSLTMLSACSRQNQATPRFGFSHAGRLLAHPRQVWLQPLVVVKEPFFRVDHRLPAGSHQRMVMWSMWSITIRFRCSPCFKENLGTVGSGLDQGYFMIFPYLLNMFFHSPASVGGQQLVAVSEARAFVSCAEPWWHCWFWAQQPEVPKELCSKLLKIHPRQWQFYGQCQLKRKSSHSYLDISDIIKIERDGIIHDISW